MSNSKSKIPPSYWVRLTSYLEAHYPELQEEKKECKIEEVCVHGE